MTTIRDNDPPNAGDSAFDDEALTSSAGPTNSCSTCLDRVELRPPSPRDASETIDVSAGDASGAGRRSTDEGGEVVDGGGPVVDLVARTRGQLALVVSFGFILFSTIYLLGVLFGDLPEESLPVVIGGYVAALGLSYRYFFSDATRESKGESDGE